MSDGSTTSTGNTGNTGSSNNDTTSGENMRFKLVSIVMMIVIGLLINY